MKIADTDTITLVGAGLAGTLLAVLLAQVGFRVRLFERNSDPRGRETAGGRSINLALAERGRHALERAGLLAAVDRYTLPMRGRMLHDERGQLTLQPYGARDEVVWSVHRGRLNRTLLDAAAATGRIELAFDHRLEGIDWEESLLHFAVGERRREVPFEVLIGADGAGSAVRQAMAEQSDLGVDEQLLDHGYLEVGMPPTDDGDFALEPEALHIWPRGGFMMIGLPNPDRSFTGTLFLPNEGEPSFAALDAPATQRRFFERHFPDAVPVMADLEGDFANNPVGLLGTIRCRRWHLGGRALLIGDAAHAIVPFHGQGMNASFEDTEAVVDALADRERGWADAFNEVEHRRRANANAIADMALENYGIMRESVRDQRFLLRKQLEHDLERRHPERFIGRYSLVMFHRVPYVEAQRRGDVQAEVLDELLAGADVLADVDQARAAALIEERLPQVWEPR